jgi:lipopolysaccharide export system protein LptA
VRLTIERMRALVLVGGALLIAALAAFLLVARWKSHFNLKEIPRRLGANIQQEANGVTYTQAHGGHTLFKIHASKVVQLKQGGRAILHDVLIELYGEDGTRVDRIAGDEFEYDQKNGIATAAGPVEITLTRPTEAMAVAHHAMSPGAPGNTKQEPAENPTKNPAGNNPKNNVPDSPIANAAKTASHGEIHVKTSGLMFDQKSGIATTAQRVEFDIAQGNGSSVGATLDSQKGRLVLDHAVELDVRRGPQKVLLHARHAEFERDNLLCRMETAEGSFRGGKAAAGYAELLFRADGSAVRLDATNGFSLTTATASQIAAPRGTLEFDEHNQPRHGRLQGGATLDSSSNGRQVHGSAPTADLAFTSEGQLQRAHLERGVAMHSEETGTAQSGESMKVTRDWSSPIADVDFRSPQTGKGQVELASVTGSGGVAITGQTQRGNGPVLPSRMAADRVTATFGDRQVLNTVIGTGHASLEQTTTSGARQTTRGDRIEAGFAPSSAHEPEKVPSSSGSPSEQIQSATVEGNVVLVQQSTVKPGSPSQASLRATAGRAVYEGVGEYLHLLVHPRVESGALQLTADKLDVSQGSGDAFAHGNVKATWTGEAEGSRKPGAALGGQGPAHIVAAEAQLSQATGEATFRGRARLWQQANSISAPVIMLDRTRQTLVAHATAASDPVRVVMLSAGALNSGKTPAPAPQNSQAAGARGNPTVIRIRGGDLKYSEAERKAVMHGGAARSVVAETGTATVVSNDLELLLLPPGNHAGADGSAAQVDRLTASGHVMVASQGRRGEGDRLVYSSESDQYVLTGTPSNPPTLADPAKGTVSGTSLIFNSRDDSVSIEGGGRKTSTETVAPK